MITRAITHYEESLDVFRSTGDVGGITFILTRLGVVQYYLGDYPKAYALLEEALELARKIGERWQVALTLHELGDVALSQGDTGRALAFASEGLSFDANLGSKDILAMLHRLLGLAHLHQGNHAQAVALLRKSLVLAREIDEQIRTAESLEALAQVAIRQGDSRRAVRLCSAADALRTAIQAPLPPVKRPAYDGTLGAACIQLGEAEFSAAWAEGHALLLEQVIAEALEPAPAPEVTPVASAQTDLPCRADRPRSRGAPVGGGWSNDNASGRAAGRQSSHGQFASRIHL